MDSLLEWLTADRFSLVQVFAGSAGWATIQLWRERRARRRERATH